mgnify:CR=1 FL=1
MDFFALTLPRLEEYFESIGENKAKAKAMYRKIYKENVSALDGLGFTPKLTKRLEADFLLPEFKIEEQLEQPEACKLLFRLADGNKIETVLMKHQYGSGLCISSQVGCNMGCAFCASGKLKKVRDLTAGEMILQIVTARRLFGNITHIVVMGIGEPFDNFESLTDALEIMNCPFGLEYGPRHITVSTCGLVPKIKELANRPHLCNLAVSLHAPDNQTRSRLMPVNSAYPVEELIGAAAEFSLLHKKKITFEYILLQGVNDSLEHAVKLADLLEDVRCYVNLIPYNETENSPFKRTDEAQMMRFYDVLKKRKMCVTIRREFGGDINAACGQLRAARLES